MTFQFKIKLNDISHPPIWRRVIIPSSYTFYQFHEVIQGSFGWLDYHLFRFSSDKYKSNFMITEKEMYDSYSCKEVIDSNDITVSEIFKSEGQKFLYLYDFGDDWFHTIIFEKIMDISIPNVDCLAGKGACPPEDCGGPWGYDNLKIILGNPKDPEYKSMKKWLGLKKNEEWDADFFDLEDTRAFLREL